MDQRDILRRLCNILLSSNSNEIQSNPDSLINTLLINAVGHLVVKTGNIGSPNPTFCLMLRGMN